MWEIMNEAEQRLYEQYKSLKHQLEGSKCFVQSTFLSKSFCTSDQNGGLLQTVMMEPKDHWHFYLLNHCVSSICVYPIKENLTSLLVNDSTNWSYKEEGFLNSHPGRCLIVHSTEHWENIIQNARTSNEARKSQKQTKCFSWELFSFKLMQKG